MHLIGRGVAGQVDQFAEQSGQFPLVIATAGYGFLSSAWRALRHRSTNMDTLISLGAGTAYVYSTVLLAGTLLGATGSGLSPRGRTLLQPLFAGGAESFVMRDLVDLLPDWNRHAYRAAVGELVDLGYLTTSGPGGRGRTQTFTLTGQGANERGIYLRDAAASPVLTTVGGLAVVGDDGSPTAGPLEEAG